MAAKEKLIQEIENTPEFLAEEVLNFLLFLKSRVQYREFIEPSQQLPEFLAFVDEINTQVPVEEWSKLPPDLSKNLDHYLYGSPKIEL
jgi:hypothetical protein